MRPGRAEVAERYTRRSQTPLRATSCGFESHLRHHHRAGAASLRSLRPYDGRAMPARPTRRFIGYPTDSLHGRAARRRVGRGRCGGPTLGRDPGPGHHDPARPRGRRPIGRHGCRERCDRPAAAPGLVHAHGPARRHGHLRAGRARWSGRADGRSRETSARKAAAITALREHGGHFINYYGRFATEEIERWRGPEPSVPGLLRR